MRFYDFMWNRAMLVEKKALKPMGKICETKGKRVSNEWEKKKQIANTNEPLHNLSYSFLFSHCHSNRFQSFNHFSPLHAWIRNELCKCLFLWTRISHYFTRCCLNVCKYMASIYFVVPRNALHTHTLCSRRAIQMARQSQSEFS